MIRNMKVYYAMRDGAWKFKDAQRPKPVIHLQNRYLAEMGFNVGDTIAVDYRPQQVIIHRTGGPTDGLTPPLPNL